MIYDVFISHSSVDKTIANAVCAMLEQNKIRCWIAPRDIGALKSWAACITQGVKLSKIIVLLLSKNSNISEHVARELDLAAKYSKIIIPFRIEEVNPSEELEYYISSRHWLDAISPPIEKHIIELSETIKKFLFCAEDNCKECEPLKVGEIFDFSNISIDERVKLLKGMIDELPLEVETIIRTLHELFKRETNGEVLYWGVKILEKIGTSEAKEIIFNKFERGSIERYKNYIEKDMVAIQDGEFMMGTNKKEIEEIIGIEVPKMREEFRNEYTKLIRAETPIHNVRINRFLIGRYTITNQLYELFDKGHKRDEVSNQDHQPVTNINWYEAKMFCRWVGCKLPTEAQWEYACRAGTDTAFNIGENITTKQVNYNGNFPYKDFPIGKYEGGAMQVGTYLPNQWGIYDMHGNVFEWCEDWYGKNYYEECNKLGTVVNPRGPENGNKRVLRGGSWSSLGQCCRSAVRDYNREPNLRNNLIGFRVVFTQE